jgi:hypothetical protein
MDWFSEKYDDRLTINGFKRDYQLINRWSLLISQLKQRVCTFRRLSKYMSEERLKMMVSEISYSKLMYCMPVSGNVHGLAIRSSSSGMTVNECNQLQVPQNSVNRLITGASTGVATRGPTEQHQHPLGTADGDVTH